MQPYDPVAPLRAAITPLPLTTRQRLTEKRAIDLLHKLLQGKLVPGTRNNRRAFGAYIKLWARRLGLNTTATAYAHTKRPSFFAMLLVHEPKLLENYIATGLGTATNISPTFWKKKHRLTVALMFARVTASQVLVDVFGYDSSQLTEWEAFTFPANVVGLADAFWEEPEFAWKKAKFSAERLLDFGQFLDAEGYLMERRKLEAALTEEGDWSPRSAMATVSAILHGRTAGWNLRTLEVLAQHNKMDGNMLAEAYAAWQADRHKRQEGGG